MGPVIRGSFVNLLAPGFVSLGNFIDWAVWAVDSLMVPIKPKTPRAEQVRELLRFEDYSLSPLPESEVQLSQPKEIHQPPTPKSDPHLLDAIMDKKKYRELRYERSLRCGVTWKTCGWSLSCNEPRYHKGPHEGESPSGLTVHWTDLDMIPPRRKGTKPLTGWRVWRMEPGPRLLSVTVNREWESPVMRTKPGTVPRSDLERGAKGGQHDHGVYSYKTPELCVSHMYFDGLWGGHYPVIGRLDLSGVVVEHEKGYRAETATIRELWILVDPLHDALGEGDRQAKELATFYKCDCHTLKGTSLKGWAKWYTDESQ